MLQKKLNEIKNDLSNEELGELVRTMLDFEFDHIEAAKIQTSLVKFVFQNQMKNEIIKRENDRNRKKRYYQNKKAKEI